MLAKRYYCLAIYTYTYGLFNMITCQHVAIGAICNFNIVKLKLYASYINYIAS